MTERKGFWVDMDDPYVTLHDNYIESAWWSLKQMFDKGLLFRGHKVLPYCPQTGTSYSSHEVAQGYKEVSEPAVFIKFKLTDSDTSILAWTTTPWTLPGNVGLAVGPEVTYCRVKVTAEPSNSWEGRGGANLGEELILAKDLLGNVLRHKMEVLEEFPGSELIGKSYEPLFPGAIDGSNSNAWTVVGADFVTTSDGTGVVHTAAMYGEDDYNLSMKEGFPAQHTVVLTGNLFGVLTKNWMVDMLRSVTQILLTYLVKMVVYIENTSTHTTTHIVGELIIRYYTTQWIVGS